MHKIKFLFNTTPKIYPQLHGLFDKKKKNREKDEEHKQDQWNFC